jgi:hypothetical protein
MPSSWRVQWPGLTEVNSVMQLVVGDYGLQVLVRLTSANEIVWGIRAGPSPGFGGPGANYEWGTNFFSDSATSK